MSHLISPHGGKLVNPMVSEDIKKAYVDSSVEFQSVHLTPRQECDLELLLTGAFSPLTGFMKRKDYERVLDEMRLEDGTLWPMPVTLDIPEKVAGSIEPGQKIALRDQEGFMLAVMTVEEKWEPDKLREARKIYSAFETSHPGVAYLFEQTGRYYIGGAVEGLHIPVRYDYRHLRRSPSEVRAWFENNGWRSVVAFQTRQRLHNAHKAMTLKAADKAMANILLHPVVGTTGPCDIDHYARVRCYEAITGTYLQGLALLNLLPVAMRSAGPREALWQAIINKNYGCSHFIVTPNHADPFTPAKRPPYYPSLAALELLEKNESELGVGIVPFEPMVYVENRAEYLPTNECPNDISAKELSSTELSRRLEYGLEIPDWFSPKEVVTELRRAYPPRAKQGFTVFFTGLSGSGKSTIARILLTRFLEMADRPVTLLDGDIVRKHLSNELGFSKEHRHINVIRIGYVASEITKNRGIALCAPIAPYSQSRRYNRELISKYGGYIEVYVATPLATCMKRDRKGLYARALAGKVGGVTGIDDPYEVPENPDVVIDTTELTPEEAAQEVLFFLKTQRYIGPSLR